MAFPNFFRVIATCLSHFPQAARICREEIAQSIRCVEILGGNCDISSQYRCCRVAEPCCWQVKINPKIKLLSPYFPAI
jgi:hypothetical protein